MEAVEDIFALTELGLASWGLIEPDDGGDSLPADELELWLFEETHLAFSAALLRTILLIEDTEGMLSASQIPSDRRRSRISQANMVGLDFL